jgi:hypothetical protein
MVVWNEERRLGGAFGRQEGPCFAVPAAIFELLAQELLGQCVVRLLEIRTNAEDSAVDAGLRFAVKERPIVEQFKHKPLVDAVDHFASLLVGRVEAEVLQDDETEEGYKVPLRPAAPVAGRSLTGEKVSSPAFGGDARPLGGNRLGGFTGKVPHDLPMDGRVRIKEPFHMRGPGCVIVQVHWPLIARGV